MARTARKKRDYAEFRDELLRAGMPKQWAEWLALQSRWLALSTMHLWGWSMSALTELNGAPAEPHIERYRTGRWHK